MKKKMTVLQQHLDGGPWTTLGDLDGHLTAEAEVIVFYYYLDI